jgi:hypothetical protein
MLTATHMGSWVTMLTATQRGDVQKVTPNRSTTTQFHRHKPHRASHLRFVRVFGQDGVAVCSHPGMFSTGVVKPERMTAGMAKTNE